MPKDEEYIIELCDCALRKKAFRQYKFPFLLGDPDRRGNCRMLPVDAFYSELNLAIEYRERQHSEAVTIMDRRSTVSGCSRAQQRRLYDERRRTILPLNGIALLELDYSMFSHNSRKRLKRDRPTDEAVIRSKLERIDQAARGTPSRACL